MASRFWTWAANLVAGQLARAEHVNDQFEEVDGAFLNVANELNRAIRFTGGSTPDESDFQVPQTADQRANLIIGFDASGNVELRSLAFSWRGEWESGENYNANDTVMAPDSHSNSLYICLTAHAADDFADDLAASRWEVIVDLTLTEQAIRSFEQLAGAFSVEAGQDVFVDTTAGAATITLPADPSIADQPITIAHAGGDATVNQITINRNGKPIQGAASDYVINVTHGVVELSYVDDTYGWAVISKITA